MGWNYRDEDGLIRNFSTQDEMLTHLRTRESSSSCEDIPGGEIWPETWLDEQVDAGVSAGQGSQRPSRKPESPGQWLSGSLFPLVLQMARTTISGSAFVIFPRPNGQWSWGVPPDEAPDNGDFSDPYEALSAAIAWAASYSRV